MIDESEHVRELSLYEFQSLLIKSPEVMTSVLESSDVQIRRAAIAAVRRFSPCVKIVMLDLIAALKDRDATVRAGAVNALASVGPAAGRAVPALIQTLKDDDAEVRKSAVLALGSIGPAASDAIPILAEMKSNDRNATVRDAAAQTVQ